MSLNLLQRTARHFIEYGAYRTLLSGLNISINKSREVVFSERNGSVTYTVSLAACWSQSFLYWLLQGYLLIPQRENVLMYDFLESRPTVVPNVWQLHHGSRQNRRRQADAYTMNLQIEPGDIVVDVGAYLGLFSLYAAESASRVLAVDPFAAIDDSLKRNVAGNELITVFPVAAWERNEQLSLQLSRYPSDSSVINPDIFPTGQEVEVSGRRVSSICDEVGIDSIDFLKIEAEGVEPEVLAGALEKNPRKVVVNCGPEREGEAPTETITDMLDEHGYEIQTVVTDQSFAPKYGESPGLSRIDMVFAHR